MTEPYPLTNASWKTERAKIHLDDLREAIINFAKSDPYTSMPYENLEGGAVRHHFVFEHPHVSIFLIAGDVFQCLRTALDQAVWSLASLSHADPDWTQFPIFGEPLNAEGRKKFERQTFGIPDKAVSVIESLQPYNRPARVPLSACALWQLHELNRIEKHRRIPVRTMGTTIARAMPMIAHSGEIDWFDVVPTDDGCDVICTGPNKHLAPRLTPHVVFGDRNSGITIYFDGIEKIYNFVTFDVLPRLAGCV